ncbi:hypothetical protein TIFTF001_032746 [Ficus carica]|uniref:Uncharacterized protein n=1 Tax=Ficus carica TaxID=3494 RepID=A0AA88J2T0_FICCA|nr:hypothetical protein TIFTF001_032640 [Ficus carica]GMN63663.1 hypothetical protein TIFTF001_032746 [Ficus carica]
MDATDIHMGEWVGKGSTFASFPFRPLGFDSHGLSLGLTPASAIEAWFDDDWVEPG